LTLFLVLSAAKGEHNDGIAIYSVAATRWHDGPPSLPKGAKIAVLEGDPSKDGPFVFRVKLPDGYRIPPHTHSKPERITVISGTFNIGMGDKVDESKDRAMPAGTYGQWPAGMKHHVWTKGETVLQFHGIGPWTITYVNPDDDPRNKKKGAKRFRESIKPRPLGQVVSRFHVVNVTGKHTGQGGDPHEVPGQEADGLDQLKGEWALVSTRDAKRTDRGDDNCRMSIQVDAEVRLRIGELTTNTGKVSAGRKAGQVDFIFKTGVVLGLYERRGDTLVICCDHEDKGRPTTLRPEGTQWCETWRLVKVRPRPCMEP
jgi:quercetin dioxygenase-like cupin family protein